MKIQKIISIITAFILCIAAFSGCTLFEKDYPVEVGGVMVEKLPERVATLSQAAASSIYSLGYSNYLVGAPSAFLNGAESGVTDLGSSLIPNEEALLELAPDVLIVADELETELMDRLTLRGVTVIKLATPEHYSDVAPYYTELAKLFIGKKNYTETTEVFLGEMERMLSELKAANSAIAKKTLVFVEGGYVVTGDTLAGEALEKAGIINAAAKGKDYIMSADEIIAADPDVIFCAVGMSDSILKNAAYKEISAIKNAAVYEINVVALLYAGEGFVATLQDMSTYLKQ